MVVMRKNEIYEFKYEFRTQVMRKKLREVPSFGMPSAHANSWTSHEGKPYFCDFIHGTIRAHVRHSYYLSLLPQIWLTDEIINVTLSAVIHHYSPNAM